MLLTLVFLFVVGFHAFAVLITGYLIVLFAYFAEFVCVGLGLSWLVRLAIVLGL